MDLGDSVARIAYMLVLASTIGRSLALEGPDQADVFAVVLWNSHVMSGHHIRHSVVRAGFKPGKEALVGVGIEGGNAASQVA